MTGPVVNAEKIPKRQREQLARPLLRLVRAAFEDPVIQAEFKKWQEERAARCRKEETVC